MKQNQVQSNANIVLFHDAVPGITKPVKVSKLSDLIPGTILPGEIYLTRQAQYLTVETPNEFSCEVIVQAKASADDFLQRSNELHSSSVQQENEVVLLLEDAF